MARHGVTRVWIVGVCVTAALSACTGIATGEDRGPGDAMVPILFTDAGVPDDAGRPDDAGQPEDAGRPDDAGQPFDAGLPDAGGLIDAGPPTSLNETTLTPTMVAGGASEVADVAAQGGRTISLPSTDSVGTLTLPPDFVPGRYTVHARMRATSYRAGMPAEDWPRVSFAMDGTEVSVAQVESTSYRFTCVGGLDLTPGSRVSARFLNDASGTGGDRNVWLDEFVLERDPGLAINGIAPGDIVAGVAGPTVQVTLLPGVTPAEVMLELIAADNTVALRRNLSLPPLCFTTAAAGGCGAFDSTLVADGPYRLRVTGTFAAGITRIQSVGFRVANRVPIAYGSPLVIVAGGVYSGAYQSTDPRVAAITVRTPDPVIIENATLRGPGALISNAFYDMNNVRNYQVRTQLTVRNVVGFGTTPTVALSQKGSFTSIEEGDDLRVENNYVDGVSQTVYARQFRVGIRPGDGIHIMRNIIRNIDGRVANGRGGYIDRDATWPNFPTANYPRGVTFMQFVQFNTILDQPNAEIGWNEIINDPGISRVEDTISFFETGGTAASPLRIHDNYLQGAYPQHVQHDEYSGGGIMTGDGGGTTLRGYIDTYSNQVIETVNYGLGVLGGHDNQVYGNRALASGILADGRIIRSQNVGLQFWDYTGGAALMPPTFYGNIVRDNVVGWASWNGSTWARNDTFIPACNTGGSMCSNNTSFGGAGSRIPANIAATEYVSWRAKVSAQSIMLGPR